MSYRVPLNPYRPGKEYRRVYSFIFLHPSYIPLLPHYMLPYPLHYLPSPLLSPSLPLFTSPPLPPPTHLHTKEFLRIALHSKLHSLPLISKDLAIQRHFCVCLCTPLLLISFHFHCSTPRTPPFPIQFTINLGFNFVGYMVY